MTRRCPSCRRERDPLGYRPILIGSGGNVRRQEVCAACVLVKKAARTAERERAAA